MTLLVCENTKVLLIYKFRNVSKHCATFRNLYFEEQSSLFIDKKCIFILFNYV